MDSYQEEESVASTSGIQNLQTLSELVGPKNAGEGELVIAKEPKKNPRRPKRYTKRKVKCVSYHAYRKLEEKHPQHIKLQDWIPTPKEMITQKVQNQDLGTILSFDVTCLKSITSLGRNDPGNDPSIMSHVLPVVTPWPMSQDHYAPTLFGILDHYYKEYLKNPTTFQTWKFTCQVDPSGKRFMGTQFWVPPLGQVNIQFYKNYQILTCCQAVDPFANIFHGTDDEMYDIDSGPDVWCTPSLCFKVIYEGAMSQKQEQKSWLCRLGHGHRMGAYEYRRIDLYVMKKGKENPYGERGDVALQYAYQVKRGCKAGCLASQVLNFKALQFHRTLMADLTNPRIGEGHLPHGYQAAMEAYGPQRGSSEERVWWNATRNQGRDGEYYREGGEEPHYPNTPAPHKKTWDERHKVLKLSSFATPSDIQRWATRALPYGWKVVTEAGDDYTSRRKIRTLTDMTQDEIRQRWERGYCDPFIDSGSDSDGPL
uniref:Bet protein n=1 Tax=Simian foamy virus TaxID=11642 RepID=K7ZBW9_9RETR|nr:bet protein [Simian foamy virus]